MQRLGKVGSQPRDSSRCSLTEVATRRDGAESFCLRCPQDTVSQNQPHTLIHRFKWSGANDIAARLCAADKLKSELSTLLNRYPEAKHFIVAHSHGANVAISALGTLPLRLACPG